MPPHAPQGALATAKCHEASDEWPSLIEIVAYFGKDGRKGKRRSVEITRAQRAVAAARMEARVLVNPQIVKDAVEAKRQKMTGEPRGIE